MKTTDFSSTESSSNLFGIGEDWWRNACVGWSTDAWNLYASGYKLAADKLAEETATEDLDLVVFPMVFLYRHYVELRLKSIIVLGNRLDGTPCEIPIEHGIGRLWQRAVGTMDIENGTIERIDILINQLAAADPTGQSFRYSVDSQGQPTLEGIEHINVRNFADRMKEVSDLLDGIIGGIITELDGQSDGLDH